MNHRGVDFTLAADPEPNVWRWQFRIGDKVTTGKAETALRGIAARARVLGSTVFEFAALPSPDEGVQA
jgi:hypothetical protein